MEFRLQADNIHLKWSEGGTEKDNGEAEARIRSGCILTRFGCIHIHRRRLYPRRRCVRAAGGLPDVRLDHVGAAPPQGGLRAGQQAAPADHLLHPDGAPILAECRGASVAAAAATELRLSSRRGRRRRIKGRSG